MIIGRELLNLNKERGDKMGHSIVRWLIVPDTWNFTDEIVEKNPENPINNSLYSACSISYWNVTEDIWNNINYWSHVKSLIKSKDKIFSYNKTDGLFDLNISNNPTLDQFEQYGLEDFSSLVTPNTRVNLNMKDNGNMGAGRIFRQEINVNEFGEIKKIEVK